MQKPPAWLAPAIPRASWGFIARWAALGGLAAGIYGIAHDAITFRIGPDYYDLFKFDQFQWADVGLPRPWFAVEIGFIASFWVGLFAAYFMARLAIPRLAAPAAAAAVRRGIALILGCAIVAFALAWGAGLLWADEGFQQVAWIHNSSYAGAILGLVIALVHIRRAGKS